MHPSSSSKLYTHTLNALSGIHRAVMHTLLNLPWTYIYCHTVIVSYKHLSTLTYAGGGEKTTTIRINRLLRNEFGDENSSLFFAKRKFSEQFKHRCYQEPISHAHTHTHKAFVDIISVSTLQNKMSCTVFITGI